MGTFFFAGIPFDLPNGVQITETAISDGFRSYYATSSGGESLSFNLTKIGDSFWTYSGDIDLSITQIGDTFTSFDGDVSGSVTKIGNIYAGMEDERRDFLSEVFDSQPTVDNSVSTSSNLQPGTFEWQGTTADDDISTFDLYLQNPSYRNFRLIGGGGDDRLSLSIMSRVGIDFADGGDGDDFIAISSHLTDYARAVVQGGSGSDFVYFVSSSPALQSDGTPNFIVDGTLIEVRLEEEEIVSAISIDVETIAFENGSIQYLTEDIYNGRIRAVDRSEAFARTYGDNSDWYIKGLDTYSEYHPEASGSTSDPYESIIESILGKGKLKGTSIADAFTFDSFDRFTKNSR